MKIVLSHPTANNFVREIANKFADEFILYEFDTCIATFPGDFLDKIAVGPLSELRRRGLDLRLKPYTKTWPWFEAGRLIAMKAKMRTLIKHERGRFSVDSVYQNLDRHVASNLDIAAANGANAVYCYEDAALETFKKAKSLSMLCVYDLPIAYWETGRKLMREEASRMPAWATTLGGGINDSKEKTDRKIKELELADIIVVPSQFVVDSLPVWAADKKIVMAPFGTPKLDARAPSPNRKNDAAKPLRVMFAGSMGQRKGLGDLFEAIKLLDTDKVELVVMGSLLDSMDFYRSQLSNFTYEPGRPNAQVLQLMQTCDVFCLPSIVEGRALVMQEAMSQGLPLIITPNTGGEDLIIEGQTGFLVPTRSPTAIAEKIQWFLDNRKKIPAMSESAKQHSTQYTWAKYGNTIAAAIKNFS